ncbi:MAG: Rv1535 family protein [Mycobacterium sp.]|uniref:Rv1535 family protein n=1 Tax=Mycobacterium sp. TaxID=1785 RepID=UPI003C656B9B
MTAVLYDEVVVPMPAHRLRAVPVPAPMAVPTPKTSKRPDPRFLGDDLLVVGAARLLCVPLRQLYAALWRAGVLEVGA